MGGGHAGRAAKGEVRGLELVVARRPRFNAACIEAEIAAPAIEGDFLFRGDMDFVFGAGNRQPVASEQFQGVVLRLH
ncbi:hypothetical protein D3C81_1003870 [compost metagenome]